MRIKQVNPQKKTLNLLNIVKLPQQLHYSTPETFWSLVRVSVFLEWGLGSMLSKGKLNFDLTFAVLGRTHYWYGSCCSPFPVGFTDDCDERRPLNCSHLSQV